jgi:MFS family permease
VLRTGRAGVAHRVVVRDGSLRSGPDRGRGVLLTLCVTEITSWGILYYAFPVLAPAISASTGWSRALTTAGFSLGLIVSAAAGVPLGRLLDRLGPRPVMTTGSVFGTAALVWLANARSYSSFLLAWTAIGLAMSGVLYQPAFAALTRWYGTGRLSALTTLTAVGGLASTVFAPLTAVLSERMDWRDTYLVLAVVLLLVTVPAHAFGLRRPWLAARTERAHRAVPPSDVSRSRPFVLLAIVFLLGAFTGYAAVIGIVPLLVDRGLSTSSAALALGIGGIGQVAGRLCYRWTVGRLGVAGRMSVVMVVAAGCTALLGLLPGPTVVLAALVVLLGTSRGIVTLLQATAVSDRWGTAYYGRLNGLVLAPAQVMAAIAPWAGSALADLLGGYPSVFFVLAGSAVTAALLCWSTVPRPVTAGEDEPAAAA